MTPEISQLRDFYPFDSHFMERQGLRYHYLDEGSGPPVVMVHGNPTWSLYYRELIRELRSDHRVIVPDHIGCGLSEMPGDDRYDFRLESRIDDLEALLDHLGVETDVSLVVHDWGGSIGLGWAGRWPSRVSRLVILNTAAFPMPEGNRLPWQLAIVRDLRPVGWLVQGLNAFAYVASRVACRSMSPELRRAYLAPYDSWENRLAVLRFVQDIPLRPEDPSWATLERIHAGLAGLRAKPALICWGARDWVFDSSFLDEWRRELPDAEVRVYEDAGHYVLEDAGAAICDEVRRFFSKHPVVGSPA